MSVELFPERPRFIVSMSSLHLTGAVFAIWDERQRAGDFDVLPCLPPSLLNFEVALTRGENRFMKLTK